MAQRPDIQLQPIQSHLTPIQCHLTIPKASKGVAEGTIMQANGRRSGVAWMNDVGRKPQLAADFSLEAITRKLNFGGDAYV
jgi:hypothetical protein